MSELITDLHLHSPYSRAVSKFMSLQVMSHQAHLKGIDLLATGDWTHPQWFSILENELDEISQGIYCSKHNPDGAKFLLSTEISCIFSQSGKGRRVHLLVFVPNLAVAAKVNAELVKRGANLHSDGRPIIGLSCMALTELVLSIDPTALVIPAHAWTPWFGVLGSKGGFDSLSEAFGEFADNIVSIETGLSSDPLMNWRIPELANRAILSFSDAHSPAKLGREATIFNFKKGSHYTYQDIFSAIGEPFHKVNKGNLKLSSTIEFYPEEGKYHWDGHRVCNVVQPPTVTREQGILCPVCGRPLTVGVEYRIEELAKAPAEKVMITKVNTETEVKLKHNPLDPKRAPYMNIVPLQEIIAEVRHKGIGSKGVITEYESLVNRVPEFKILLTLSAAELKKVALPEIVEAILQVRRGELTIDPGFDGVYGKVTVTPKSISTPQASLF